MRLDQRIQRVIFMIENKIPFLRDRKPQPPKPFNTHQIQRLADDKAKSILKLSKSLPKTSVLRQKIPEIPLGDITEYFESYKKVEEHMKFHYLHTLSAPKIGLPLRFFAMDKLLLMDRSHIAPDTDYEICVNPKVISQSTAQEYDFENCTAVEGCTGHVARAVKVSAGYFNRFGEYRTQNLRGVAARAFLHELDHLNGVLFTDYLKLSQVYEPSRESRHDRHKKFPLVVMQDELKQGNASK